MTRDEAVKVLDIMSHADGGCPVCVKNLFRQFIRAFPEHYEALNEVALAEGFEREEIDHLTSQAGQENR